MKNKGGKITNLSDFPSVEILSGDKKLAPYIERLSKALVVQVIRDVIERLKIEFQAGHAALDQQSVLSAVTKELGGLGLLNLQPVVNGAGIIIHTNLGRAPLAKSMVDNAMEMLTGYSNLEFDLATGRRGNRGMLIEKLLAVMCETEAGTLVNNNAAALFVILNTLANRKEVIISRGELVQIGGGFRIPDIMVKSGAKLVEVGTTNRTTIDDYARAITDRTRMILKVHRSNFAQEGFVEETSIKELSSVCREKNIVLVHDLGSGLISFPPGTEIVGEPSISDSVRAGADLTCFSGDKLLGGTQAGLIAGRKELVDRIKKNQLFRVLRCDKIVFSITAQVLLSYIRGTQFEDLPAWRMISVPVGDLKLRGEKILTACKGKKDISLIATRAYLGGGTTPAQSIPSLAVSLRSKIKPNALAARFRAFSPPIIGRVEKEEFLIDLRTATTDQDKIIIEAINKIVP